MSRGFDDEAIASARGCICGGCDECLRGQGLVDDDQLECDGCSTPHDPGNMTELVGRFLCDDCLKLEEEAYQELRCEQ